MLTLSQHPATRTLRQQVSAAQWARMLDGFRSPRRMLLSIIALSLGLLWVGQAAAGVFLRSAADPVRLTAWLTVGLFGFATWNLLKIAFRKPVEPFEWALAEKEWLLHSPLNRQQLIDYRLATIAGAAVFKAALFSVVMTPDLTFLLFGFLGLFIGLMLIELSRMTGEVAVWGMTDRQRLFLKVVVGVAFGWFALTAIKWFMVQYEAGEFRQLFSLGFIACAKQGLIAMPDTVVGQGLMLPFRWLAEAMLATTLSFSALAKLTFGATLVFVLSKLLVHVDAVVQRVRVARMQAAWASGEVEQQAVVEQQKQERRLSRKSYRVRLPQWGGAGALIWRQLLGVNHYRSTVLVAMIVPGILALGPAFNSKTDLGMMQQMVLLISCYSFLLLPTAFKFDFRRDLDRMAVLKAIPAKPMTVVWGQVAVPVWLTSSFQLALLLVAMIINPYPIGYLISAMSILVPCNVFIFAVENLMFLLYPYRVSEEGLRVFLRTILAFTAKGILMAVGMGLALLTYLGSRLFGNWIANGWGLGGIEFVSLTTFSCLATFGLSLIALVTLHALARAFDRLDLSSDLNSVQAS